MKLKSEDGHDKIAKSKLILSCIILCHITRNRLQVIAKEWKRSDYFKTEQGLDYSDNFQCTN